MVFSLTFSRLGSGCLHISKKARQSKKGKTRKFEATAKALTVVQARKEKALQIIIDLKSASRARPPDLEESHRSRSSNLAIHCCRQQGHFDTPASLWLARFMGYARGDSRSRYSRTSCISTLALAKRVLRSEQGGRRPAARVAANQKFW